MGFESGASAEFSTVVDLLMSIVEAVYGYFYTIFDRLGAFPFFITMFVVLLLTRLILIPFFGRSISGASDMVKHIKSDSDQDRSSAASDRQKTE
ncbi:MAG: hypothetical protein IKC26_04670 [Clostridia bacterium]|nr:hypothetical protein [Clostridia bacterium]